MSDYSDWKNSKRYQDWRYESGLDSKPEPVSYLDESTIEWHRNHTTYRPDCRICFGKRHNC